MYIANEDRVPLEIWTLLAWVYCEVVVLYYCQWTIQAASEGNAELRDNSS